MNQEIKLVITESDPFDRESDSELDEMLNEEYYPTSEDEESSDAETSDSEEDESKPLERTGIIYRLTAEGCDKVYIGSTVNLKNRISLHKTQFKKGIIKCSSKLIMAYGNYTFTEIASLLYTDIKQLRRLEADIILEHGDKVVNIQGTKDRHTKDYMKDYNKEYNSKRILCECCKKEILLKNKIRHSKTKKHILKSK